MINNRLCGYSIVIEKRAQKFLESLDEATQTQIINKLKMLVTQTHCLDIKKLKGYNNLFRVKIDNVRIVYEPMHKIITIYVIYIGFRKSVYEELKRLYK